MNKIAATLAVAILATLTLGATPANAHGLPDGVTPTVSVKNFDRHPAGIKPGPLCRMRCAERIAR